MKKVYSILLIMIVLLTCVFSSPIVASAEADEIPIITYQFNGVTMTADLLEIGTWTPASSYANSKVYLASLPYGASVTSYSVGDYNNLAHMVYGLNTTNLKTVEALTDSSNYLTNEEFVGTGLANNVQYYKTALGKLDEATTTKAKIPTSNVKGYGLRITGLTGFSPLIIVQISTESDKPTITYQNNLNKNIAADLFEIGTWTPASSYANSKVYLASLPYGASVTSYSVGDYNNLAHMVYGLNTTNLKTVEALTDSSNYLTNEEFVGTGLANNVQYYKTVLGKLDEATTTKAKIPTSNVKGYGLRITGLTGFSPLVIIQISTVESGGATINKSALEDLISSVTSGSTQNYYQEKDHYNGRETSEIGFWAEMLPVLSAAQTVFSNASATQLQVNTAYDNLNAAIAKLIPVSQLNATVLHEALQATVNYSWDENSALYLGNYTSVTAAAFDTARENAQIYLDSLFFDGVATEVNIAANQSVADSYASALLTARNNLLTKDMLTEAQRYRDTVVKLDEVFSGLDTEKYETVSWNAFETARSAAAELITDHPVNDSMTRSEYDEYVSTTRAYWLAAYGLRSKTTPTVTVYFSDDFGMRYPEYALGGTYNETLTMEAGTYTLKALLTQAGLSTLDHLGLSERYDSGGLLWDDWLIYINGVLIRDPIWMEGDVAQTVLLHDKDEASSSDWNDICIRDGELVTLARVESALKPTFVGGESVGMEDKASWFGQLSLTLNQREVKEGEAISGTITRFAANLPDFNGRSTAYPYATLAAYGPIADNGSVPAKPIIGEEGGSLTLNKAGTYLIVAFEARAQDMSGRNYPNLNVSSLPIAVIVDPLNDDELTAEKESSIRILEDTLAECSVEEFGEDVYEQIADIVYSAKGTISTADSLEDIRICLSTALEEISVLKNAVSDQNDLAYRRMSSLLMLLPTESEISTGLFTQGDSIRMNEAISHYESMTDYQRAMLTAEQTSQWESLQNAWESDGSSLGVANQIDFAIEVVGGFGERLDNRLNRVTTAKYSYAQTNDTYYVTNTRNDIATLSEPVVFAFDAPLESWILSIYYTESDEFEVYKVTWTGVEDDYVEYTLEKVDNQYQLFVKYTDALKQQIMKPSIRGDVKVTIYTRSTGELASQQAAAIALLDTAYASYSKSDYTAENWAELTAAYSTGVAAINAAASEEAIGEAKQTALDAMAIVPKKTAEELGSVTVIVENTTFDETDIKGTLASATLELVSQSTMMKCVLTALAEKGYSWTGTGGKDYEILYLSSIYIDANGNGKKDSDEKSLGEFDGGPQSGWMGTLNDWFVNEGFPGFTVANGKLKDGDVIRVQYTVSGYGTDLGATWANNDTSLKELAVDGGSFGPEFNGSVLEYVLTPEGGSVSILPTAANKNFQVRVFLNQQNKNANADYYRQGESIPVKSGDVIWIGIGEPTWPTMNDGSITGTWYKLNVVSSDDANAVVKLINAIGNVTYSNYKTKQNAVDLARTAYDALNSGAQSSVTNLNALQTAETAIAGYLKVDALKAAIAALPRNITEADREAVEVAKEIYDDLADNAANLLNLLSVAETNKLLEAVNALTEQPKSDDAGVKSIKVNGVKATGSGTNYAVTLPIGSDVAAATFEIEPADKANVTDGPTASDGGTTWSFTVTAEDGVTSETYTVTLTVSQMEVNVLECAIYSVTDDVTVVDLSPVVVTGLREAVKVEELGLPETAQSVSLWLKVTAVSKNGSDITVKLEPMFAVDGGEEQAVPDDALIGSFTVTLPISCTANARVLYGTTYVNATGSDSSITFTAPGIGSYKIIPDAQIQGDAPAIGNGSTEGTTENGVTTFAAGTAADAPTVSVTAPEGGWTVDGTTANSFTVSCENDTACVVLVKSADGSYTRLIADNAGTTHTFHTALNLGDELVVVRKGDISGDGKLSGPEVTQIKAAQLEYLTTFTVLQNLVADLDGNGVLSGPEVTQIKAAQLGFLALTW